MENDLQKENNALRDLDVNFSICKKKKKKTFFAPLFTMGARVLWAGIG